MRTPKASTEDRPVLRVTCPADLISAVPYLLGFHPSESVVVIGMAEGQVVVTIRVDLDEVLGTGQLGDAVCAMHRGGAVDFVVIVFDDRAAPTERGDLLQLPWRGVVDEVGIAAEFCDGQVYDALLVARDRHWSYLCENPTCCPPEGKPRNDATSSVAAEAIYAGMVALPDRDSVEQLLDQRPASEREVLRPSIDRAIDEYCEALITDTTAQVDRSIKRAIFALHRSVEAGGALPDDPERLGRIAAALRRIDVRDAVWTAVDDGRLVGDRLWRHLARVLPSPYDASPLFLIGWRSWRSGSGALARIAADRALSSDPGYSAADLLIAALQRAVDPRQVPRLRNRRRDAS